jgi:hypothetical protein
MTRDDLNPEEDAIFAARDARAAALVVELMKLGDEFTAQAARLTGKSGDDNGTGRAQTVIAAAIRGLIGAPGSTINGTARGIAGGLAAAMIEGGLDCDMPAYAHQIFHQFEETETVADVLASVEPQGNA